MKYQNNFIISHLVTAKKTLKIFFIAEYVFSLVLDNFMQAIFMKIQQNSTSYKSLDLRS